MRQPVKWNLLLRSKNIDVLTLGEEKHLTDDEIHFINRDLETMSAIRDKCAAAFARARKRKEEADSVLDK